MSGEAAACCCGSASIDKLASIFRRDIGLVPLQVAPVTIVSQYDRDSAKEQNGNEQPPANLGGQAGYRFTQEEEWQSGNTDCGDFRPVGDCRELTAA